MHCVPTGFLKRQRMFVFMNRGHFKTCILLKFVRDYTCNVCQCSPFVGVPPLLFLFNAIDGLSGSQPNKSKYIVGGTLAYRNNFLCIVVQSVLEVIQIKASCAFIHGAIRSKLSEIVLYIPLPYVPTNI